MMNGYSAYKDIYYDKPNCFKYPDAIIGTAGIISTFRNRLVGTQIPYVGEFVALYAIGRLVWDIGWYAGERWGPSTWYGTDDTKYFE